MFAVGYNGSASLANMEVPLCLVFCVHLKRL